MRSVTDRIQAAQSILSPLGVSLAGGLGRCALEDDDQTRFPFQRDRDRIIHSLSFRRLKGKTQVFVAGASDHFRTRLTHTMEVTQISRDIARTMELNEDLAECIALAHDLGHSPFGHAGEEVLNEWMEQHGSSFEHNEQSVRIVTILESRSSQYMGLNLNLEVLEGLKKHRTPFDQTSYVRPGRSELRLASEVPRHPSLEAQIVNIADEIAYTGHDIDDGLRAKLFTMDDLSELTLAQEARKRSAKNGTALRGALIHLLVMDLYEETERQLDNQKIKTLDDIYAKADSPVRFSEAIRTQLDALREFLWKRMYMHPDVQEKAKEGKEIVWELCEYFLKHPNEKIGELMQMHGDPLFVSVKDYVAGMTDAFAEGKCERIVDRGPACRQAGSG